MPHYAILSEREQEAIIDGLRILQRDMERHCADGDGHDGLSPDEIDELIEERVNCGVLLQSKTHQHPPQVPDEMLAPPIEAEAYPDDRPFTVEFYANRWFAAADPYDIIDLASEDWANSEASDRVAEDVARWDADVQQVFNHQGVISAFGDCSVGFECRVNGEQAMSWLQQHRPEVWAQILCEQHNIRLVEAAEPEIAGRWDWIDDKGGNASEASLETIGEAAIDAVTALDLDYQPESV